MKLSILILTGALIFTGCSTATVTHTELIPTQIKCDVKLPTPPTIDNELKGSPEKIIEKVLNNYEKQKKYSSELLILLNRCR